MSYKKFFTGIALMLTVTYSVLAQDDKNVTDEELKAYAITMDSVKSMSAQLVETLSEKVKHNDKMTGNRYNDLSGIIDNEAKLTEASATPEEIAFIKEVLTVKKDGTAKIQETFQTLAKDYVGASAFNKIRASLKTDAELKAKYESIVASLKK